MTNSDRPDRRAHQRRPGSQPCKVLDPRGCRFYAGFTIDTSPGGALIEIPRAVPMRPDDTLRVDVVIRPDQGLIKAADMRQARIVRTLESTEGRTLLAIQYTDVARACGDTRRAA